MPSRKVPLVNEEYYHIYNRGLNKQKLFRTPGDYARAYKTIQYYKYITPLMKFSHLNLRTADEQRAVLSNLAQTKIDILAYCFMPNHFHFLVKQNEDDGIVESIGSFSNSYSHYFNLVNERKGPAFEGRFKAVRVSSNEQLIHLSRYIHLNPYTSLMETDIKNISKFPYSSLKEYMNPNGFNLSEPEDILSQFESSQDYLNFIRDQADYQRQLHLIKKLSLDDVD